MKKKAKTKVQIKKHPPAVIKVKPSVIFHLKRRLKEGADYETTVAKKQTMDDILKSIVSRKEDICSALCEGGDDKDDAILTAQLRVVNEVIIKLNLMREKI